MMREMPSWNHTGHNHVIWDYIDNRHIKYRTDGAVAASRTPPPPPSRQHAQRENEREIGLRRRAEP